MLCLADRNFACWELWHDAAATGAQLLWRIGASFTLPVDEILPDGTYLSRLKAPRKLSKDGAADITVRVVEYRLEDENGEVTETFTLITTLLEPVPAPARELAELYKARWEIEVGHRWHRSSHAAFSRLCSLFLVGFLFLLWRCPAGAGVEAGRACPALA